MFGKKCCIVEAEIQCKDPIRYFYITSCQPMKKSHVLKPQVREKLKSAFSNFLIDSAV